MFKIKEIQTGTEFMVYGINGTYFLVFCDAQTADSSFVAKGWSYVPMEDFEPVCI